MDEHQRDPVDPVDQEVLKTALSAALGAFELVLVTSGRTDLDYFDRIEALEGALDDLGIRLEKHLDPKVH